MESKMFAFGLFMLLCIVQSSAALKCYNCDSAYSPRCANIKGSGIRAQECGATTLFGQPTCMKVVFRDGDSEIIFRNCTEKVMGFDACVARKSFNHNGLKVDFCDTCDTNGCNSGNSMQLFFTLIVFGAIVCTARLFI